MPRKLGCGKAAALFLNIPIPMGRVQIGFLRVLPIFDFPHLNFEKIF
jgi:hypothetical protein